MKCSSDRVIGHSGRGPVGNDVGRVMGVAGVDDDDAGAGERVGGSVGGVEEATK